MRSIARNRGNRARYSALLRSSGLGAVLAGVLFVVWGYVHRPNLPVYQRITVEVLSLVVPALFIMGLAGLHALCKGQVGRFGRTGLALCFTGPVLGALHSPVHLVYWYALEKGGWLFLLWSSGWPPILFAGLMLVSVSTVWTTRLRGLGTLTFAMGAFGWVYYLTDVGGIVETRMGHVVSGLLLGLSWVVLGGVLLREGSSQVTKPRS